MELPFAVESPERTSQLLPASTTANTGDCDDDGGSSLVTTSSQGSFLGSSSGTGGGGGGFLANAATTRSGHILHVPHQHQQQPHHLTTTPHHHHHHHLNTINMNIQQPPVARQQQHQQHHQHPARIISNHPPASAPHPHHHQQPQPRQQPHHHYPQHATPVSTPIVSPLPPTAPRPSSSSNSAGRSNTSPGLVGGIGTTVAGGITSGLNIFGALRSVPSVLQSKPKSSSQKQQQQRHTATPTETIDFTYVNVCETDADEVDITMDGQHTAMEGLQGMLGDDDGNGEAAAENKRRGDILILLLSGVANQNEQENSNSNEDLVRQCEEANQAACQAMEAKRDGDLQAALTAHSQAARQFRDAAVLVKDRNEAMANSLLLLSQTQAKAALALKRIVKQQPIPHDSNASDGTKNPRSKIITQKDRLRAAVRGALVTRNEEEMSDSAFLGKATKGPMTGNTSTPTASLDSDATSGSVRSSTTAPPLHTAAANQHNPVDDMMELERELRDMDMALELGNSIASLDARTQSRLKNSIGVDGSFMVVPPGSQSYMSSSNMWTATSSSTTNTNQQRSNNKQTRGPTPGTAGVRQRANRVQNLVGGPPTTNTNTTNNNPRSPSHGLPQHQHQQHLPPGGVASRNNPVVAAAPAPSGLESSWWGNSSTASQVLASSVISLGASSVRPEGPTDPNASSANTKQLMRLMDALKTLGDENANLLREVEEAEAARMEAKAAKEQMAKFKSEYAKRFENLKAALEKFRKGYPEHGPPPAGGGCSNERNPVTNSEFMRSASTTEQLQRQDQLIRKLTADLKKEKEESKKKDQALRKYESFYREVKARSAQKAAQRQREQAGQCGSRPPQPHQASAGNRRSQTGHR